MDGPAGYSACQNIVPIGGYPDLDPQAPSGFMAGDMPMGPAGIDGFNRNTLLTTAIPAKMPHGEVQGNGVQALFRGEMTV
jgi:hypothetical protein